MKKCLFLFEKPTQETVFLKLLDEAEDIFTSNNRGHKGKYQGNKVFTFPLSGKIIEIDDSPIEGEKEDWSDFSVLPKIPKKRFFKRRVSSGGAKIFKKLKELVSNNSIDFIILATDEDYEGMALGVEALEFSGLYDKVGEENIVAMRMGTVTEKALDKEAKKALNYESSINWKIKSFIAKIRNDLNYSIGITGTRMLTTYLKGMGISSLGLQQTRLLSTVSQRTLEFKNHKEVQSYSIDLLTDYGAFSLELSKELKEAKGNDKSYFERIIDEIKDTKKIKIESITAKRSIIKSGDWFCGATIASEVAPLVKIKVSTLLDKDKGLIQELYEEGITTYPRGEEMIMPISEFKEQQEIAQKLQSQYHAPRLNINLRKKQHWFEEGEMDYAHTPYTLTEKADKNLIVNKEKDKKIIFDVLAKKLLSIFYPENEVERKKIDANIGKYTFSLTSISDIDVGWREIYQLPKREDIFKDISKGDEIEIKEIKLHITRSKPKPLFTEKSLLAVMKQKKYGTPATYSTLLKRITDDSRKYTTTTAGKISSTHKADGVIKIIKENSVILDMLSLFDRDIVKNLEKNKISEDEAINKIRTFMNEFYSDFSKALKSSTKEIDAIIKAGGDSNSPFIEETNSICPLCQGKIKLIEPNHIFLCEKHKKEKIDGKFVLKEGACPFIAFGKSKNHNIDKEKFNQILLEKKKDTQAYILSLNKPKQKKIKASCPNCGSGIVLQEGNNIFMCEKHKKEKIDGKFVLKEGACSFIVFGSADNRGCRYKLSIEEFENLLKDEGVSSTEYYWKKKKKKVIHDIVLSGNFIEILEK